MAISTSRVLSTKTSKRRLTITDVTLDSSYPTGGEAVTAGDLGLGVIQAAMIQSNTGHILQWDQTNKKIKAYYADYDAVADGALIEVPDTTDLSSVVATVWAIGR